MQICRASIILVSFLFLSSCGQHHSSGAKKNVVIYPQEITQFLDNQQFECASINGGPCPAGIGRVFIIDPIIAGNSGLCSGYLTAPDVMVTNNHCLSTPDQCANTYVSVFNGSSQESAKCVSIIHTEKDSSVLIEKSIDVTVMKLDHPINGQVFSLANQQPILGDQLTAWVVDQIDLFRARITEFNCVLVNDLKSLLLGHCAAIEGNSGSPVLNQQNEIIGVLWGVTSAGVVDEVTPLTLRRSLNESAFVTKLKYYRGFL